MLNWLQQDPGGFLLYMLYRAPAVLLALTIHELAHGYAALKAGDTTARDMGRLTMNPLRHLDPLGTLSMFLMGVGWAKPVPVNPNRFRKPRWDDLKVSLAGVATNFLQFLLAVIISIFISQLLYTPEALSHYGTAFFLRFDSDGFVLQLFPQYAKDLQVVLKTPWLLHVQRFIFQLAFVNLGMGLFNLLPIPPLDGFHVVNNLIFQNKINLSGKVFRFTHLALMLLLFSTNFVGNWVSKALYAIQGAILPVLLSLFGAG